MNYQRTIEVLIRGINETIELSLERSVLTRRGKSAAQVSYWIDATCRGFSLCHIHYGYYKSRQSGNARLKSKKSTDAEATAVLDSYEMAIRADSNHFIISDLVIPYNIRDDENQLIAGHWLPATSFKSLQSGLSISWYHQYCFNTDTAVNCHIKRNSEGYLEVFIDETELYDLEKLSALADSQDFKEKRFAFFSYNEVNRLLGRTTDGCTAVMSGLFAAGASI